MNSSITTREYWVNMLTRISEPVLTSMAQKEIKSRMPLEAKDDERVKFTYFEALARTLSGIAPWLELEDVDQEERKSKERFCSLARQAMDAATDPNSPDYCNFSTEIYPRSQILVDAAFLAHAIFRAPKELWNKLDTRVKKNVITALKAASKIRPVFNNWILFSAMVQTGLYVMGEEYDDVHIDYAIRQMEQWYAGDGCYKDGTHFALDYYNSYVIQPMMVDIVSTFSPMYTESNHERPWGELIYQSVMKRAQRYAEIQERMIAPDGSFAPVGRSIVYRSAAFQLLAQLALQKKLPNSIAPSQVRSALTSVIKKCFEPSGTFDQNDWLKIGLAGSQPNLGEDYISTGSLYLCTTAFLPLGLSAKDEFWSGEDMKWTWQKIWSGEDLNCDHALGNE